MNSLSGARKLCTSISSSGAISVSMSMTGTPAWIIFSTGAVSVPMLKGWMATKSHFWFAMSSIAARCLASESPPSNQVTSTLKSLPQYSAACLPWAHQLTCRPILEKAAFSNFSDRPAILPDFGGERWRDAKNAQQRNGSEARAGVQQITSIWTDVCHRGLPEALAIQVGKFLPRMVEGPTQQSVERAELPKQIARSYPRQDSINLCLSDEGIAGKQCPSPALWRKSCHAISPSSSVIPRVWCFLTAPSGPAAQYGTAEEAKAMLEGAVVAVKEDKAKALNMFNKGEGGFKDRDLYVFCANASDGILTAHPYLKGEHLQDIKGKKGYPLGQEMMQNATEGTIKELTYWWPRPGSDKPLEKITFYTRVGDQDCGVGYYKE